MAFDDRLPRYIERLEERLEAWLPEARICPRRLHEAMRYAALGGGKRMRPVLVYATGEAIAADPALLDPAATSVELLHAYSLVHDDLPSMDDDDLRRGRPTCHKAFDEATAVLVGDALQNLAFHVLAHDQTPGLGAPQRLQMIQHLTRATGSRGMVGGQALDLAAEGRELDAAELETVHIHKTGALIRASVLMAAAAQPALDEDVRERLDHFAKCVGLAFQVRDDILDVEADTQTLGKTQGADTCHDKATFPSVMGLDESRRRARELIEQANDSLSVLADQADGLRWIADYIVDRRY